MRRVALVLAVAACGKSSAPDQAPAPGDKAGEPIGGGRGRPVLELGDGFTAAGDIDKSAVRSTVKANLEKLRTCYERALLVTPGIEGTCVATFKVAIDGSVREAKASGVHPDVEACVADVVRTFKFPASTAEVEVQYPFTFRAN